MKQEKSKKYIRITSPDTFRDSRQLFIIVEKLAKLSNVSIKTKKTGDRYSIELHNIYIDFFPITSLLEEIKEIK